MAVLANVSSPSSYSGCLHAVSLSCYNNALWMGVSNCSLWRIELPLVDDVDISRDSLAEMSIKPKVTCELWSGMSHTPRSNTLLAHWSVFLILWMSDCVSRLPRRSHHDHAVIVVAICGSFGRSSSSHSVLQWLHLSLEHRYHFSSSAAGLQS
jgi:hypothetical protein